MKLYSSDGNYKLYHGNMLDMLEVIEPNSIEAIVTDPPYELNFMNKSWDNSGIAFQKETWKKCYDVLKSGGHMLVFGGSRTFHRIACAIEDAGFEIRDTILWLYGSGFPKSMNIGLAIDKKNGVDNRTEIRKHGNCGSADRHLFDDDNYKWVDNYEERQAQNEWAGWGTQLKPSYEPIIVCRKPCEGSIVDNVMKYGVGGINIDECRIPTEDDTRRTSGGWPKDGYVNGTSEHYNSFEHSDKTGRFPANTILTYDDSDYDEVCGGFPNNDKPNGSYNKNHDMNNKIYGKYNNVKPFDSYGDSGSASRYFYCAKASKRDRDEGLEEFELKENNLTYGDGFNCKTKLRTEKQKENNEVTNRSLRHNIHPTVKPTSLMAYLVRLVTPKGGTVLDPFNGSGSTGKACMYENADRKADYKYIGIELTEEYLPISKARIEFAEKNPIMDYEIKKAKTETNKIDDEKSETIFDLI